MFELKVRTHFSAAHKILEHPGKCRNLHGHNWNVDVTVEASDLDRIGLAVDFSQIKAIVKEVIEPLDHVYLNDLPQFSTVQKNPSAENISQYIYAQVKARLRSAAPQADIKRVDLYETETCSASYYE
jgi:6-pyruvoyltetrahydropterin/6-carboxytetrahydropterin synthase